MKASHLRHPCLNERTCRTHNVGVKGKRSREGVPRRGYTSHGPSWGEADRTEPGSLLKETTKCVYQKTQAASRSYHKLRLQILHPIQARNRRRADQGSGELRCEACKAWKNRVVGPRPRRELCAKQRARPRELRSKQLRNLQTTWITKKRLTTVRAEVRSSYTKRGNQNFRLRTEELTTGGPSIFGVGKILAGGERG